MEVRRKALTLTLAGDEWLTSHTDRFNPEEITPTNWKEVEWPPDPFGRCSERKTPLLLP
jgi:hypothetical protein